MDPACSIQISHFFCANIITCMSTPLPISSHLAPISLDTYIQNHTNLFNVKWTWWFHVQGNLMPPLRLLAKWAVNLGRLAHRVFLIAKSFHLNFPPIRWHHSKPSKAVGHPWMGRAANPGLLGFNMPTAFTPFPVQVSIQMQAMNVLVHVDSAIGDILC